ncbi:MAG: leucine-rich repeat domain-containing protein [Methylococcales bacterium]
MSDLVADSAQLSFTAPNITSAETLTFTLTTTDDFGDSSSTELNIDVSAYDEIQYTAINDNGLLACLKADEAADMGLTTITCDGYVVSSFTDLAKFEKLTDLSLTNAKLVDISELAGYTQLTSLNVSNNNIVDISTKAVIDFL